MNLHVRDYRPDDETAWLRCRAVAFLGTAYFDAVEPRRPPVERPGFGLVATVGGEVVGLLDTAVEFETGTIEHLAVHPDHRSRGIGRALLDAALERAARLDLAVIEAWTRDDPGTLRWYRSNGFAESDRYLHVYADYYTDPAEPDRAIRERGEGLRPVRVFAHGDIGDEAAMRERFARVHVCRRFSRSVRMGA